MAFDSFMFFEGGDIPVAGETTDSVYAKKKAFEIYSFSWGASNPSSIGSGTTGGGAGRASVSSFNVMKKTDNSSPQLFQACVQGDHYDKATVVLRKAGGTDPVEYLSYVFSTVFVDSVQWSGSSGGDDAPTESVSFSFGTCEIYYLPQSAKGDQSKKNSAAWNFTTNAKP